MDNHLILVTGATGYIAGRLIPQLLQKGYRVRCMARDPRRLHGRTWYSRVEVVAGDVTLPETLPPAMQDVRAAYYLIHNMSSGRDYTRRDLQGARNFARAAAQAGIDQIIYLGGLADPQAPIAPHIRSRIETGQALREGPVPVTEFRAGVIVGPGSISFEMIRFITEQFPIVVGPRWLLHRTQPIDARNVLDYLLSALDVTASRGGIYEIGGQDVMTYTETMLRYARLRGLWRGLITIPFLPLELMAWGVDKLTPVPLTIARPLIEGLKCDSLVRVDDALRVFPHIQPTGYETAVTYSLSQLSPEEIEHVWTDDALPVTALKHEGFFVDHRRILVDAPPEAIYRTLTGLGGANGWLVAGWLWQLRGWIDRLVGGPGLRGRSDPQTLRRGDTLDFYRVEVLQPQHMLRLYSELKAPGDGWMEWRVVPQEDGDSLLTQTGFFAPRGVPGFLYWYVLSPFHVFVLRGLIRALAHKAEA